MVVSMLFSSDRILSRIAKSRFGRFGSRRRGFESDLAEVSSGNLDELPAVVCDVVDALVRGVVRDVHVVLLREVFGEVVAKSSGEVHGTVLGEGLLRSSGGTVCGLAIRNVPRDAGRKLVLPVGLFVVLSVVPAEVLEVLSTASSSGRLDAQGGGELK